MDNYEINKNSDSQAQYINEHLYIVGIGASAGGLEALQILLKNLPLDLNCAYVIAQHLSPTHKSMMVPLLARETSLNVLDATDGVEIKKGCVYVTPPDKDVFIGQDSKLHLQVAQGGTTPKPCVDLLFESLSEIKKEYAIGLILSGTGSDGSRGIRAIKAEGGFTLAQEPSEAKYDGMPRSAINTGHVDLIISVRDFAVEFEELIKLPRVASANLDEDWQASLKEQIFSLLLREKRVDFSSYKQSTINRRIERRMSALKISSLHDYVEYLKNNYEEIISLYQDLLIGVTSFFRDPDAFESMNMLLKARLEQKNKGDSIRVWIAGCSTGEEAYSVAIVLSELLGPNIAEYKIQIFATDIDEKATAHARRGLYTESAISSIKKIFLKKYFTKKGDAYEIIKPLRDMVIFSMHDLVKDPPFLRIDLLLCRNVLIYFNQSLQQKIMAAFHHALDVNGILFLGKSESILTREDWFVSLDKRAKIFKSLYSGRNEAYVYSTYTQGPSQITKQKTSQVKSKDLKETAKDLISENVFPYYVVLNEGFDILYFSGEDNPYFSIGRSGDATLNLFKLIIPELNIPARAVSHEAKKINAKALSKILYIDIDNDKRYLQMLCVPFSYEATSRYFMFAFIEYHSDNLELFLSATAQSIPNEVQLDKELEIELANMREYLQTVIEELETTNEELQGANEELQSSNEELQTTNEELQSTNEELQIAYTELRLMYDEREQKKLLLEAKNRELEELSSKLENLNIELNERVAAEVEIRIEKEAYISAIYDKVKIAICLSDEDGKLYEYNDYFLKLLGYKKSEFVSVCMFDILDGNSLIVCKKAYKETLENKLLKPEEELVFKHKTHDTRTVLAVFSEFKKYKKRFILISMIDRTEVKALEAERSKQDALLLEQSRSAQMGEMMSMVAHQWRQPLNVVNILAAECMYRFSEGSLDQDMMRKLYDDLLQQTAYMSKTIEDFREFFKKGEEKEFSIKDAISAAISLAEAQLKAHYIKLESILDECKIVGNEHELTQVILTLISNSKDAILERQKNERLEGYICVKSNVEREFLAITVTDNGKGATKDVINRMFDPYFTTKHPTVGTGIGLHMARTIINRNLNGTISGKNLVSVGFEILIKIPILQTKDRVLDDTDNR